MEAYAAHCAAKSFRTSSWKKVITMTKKQLEKKARQLLYRKRLAEGIEGIEEGIKAHLHVNEIKEAITKSFFIRICGNELVVDLKPSVDPRQLRLRLERNS